MKVLAFDTSNQTLSVALVEDSDLQADMTLTVQKNHSVSLMPTVDFLMQQVGWKPSDLEKIVVAQGPGSYTGLRVAVATAKTLAYSLGIDLVGVSSLQALALPVKTDAVLIPLIDARRQHAYVGFYQNGKALAEDTYASIEVIIDKAKAFDQVIFVGEVAPFQQVILEALPQAICQPSLPSAYEIGKMALHLPSVDVDAFLPNYLKKVEAEENWLKTHEEGPRDAYIKRV
ncbi:tRNA (adenosine(37)-N6)-threonylcarbamoyltransferase complex dimerization subunit type 1 TsaB [Streptococcus hyovaginalis]|uniref:tRNA (adenosine(37)-N6)-threonylcarbamoyltransferase complex dimerization subunit type 1 TsaB n=1 Tax=Streptococcus hyovaginalis TaxID=149015 RepID=UPI002A91698E|nr:tRNA (adenosine(37)-N6)-threonylcarbamoyltransferase complex dimerization subunit type 1 TsaB [Streptococcus hyovaginalis]MDY5974951.1 tRNA (adenosine(37)-N6)-threonylcarbamoyltransferase complex dimerization subunit type 1 TsaB [Streptococcus hyovaginalis]